MCIFSCVSISLITLLFANLGSVRLPSFEVRRPSRSEDTAHLVCQLSIYNSFPVIRTTIAKKLSFLGTLAFIFFALGMPLRQSRKTLHK